MVWLIAICLLTLRQRCKKEIIEKNEVKNEPCIGVYVGFVLFYSIYVNFILNDLLKKAKTFTLFI